MLRCQRIKLYTLFSLVNSSNHEAQIAQRIEYLYEHIRGPDDESIL